MSLRDLRETLRLSRAQLELIVPPAEVARMRAVFDQLSAEAADANLDPVVFGAMSAAYLIVAHDTQPLIAVALISLWHDQP
jgi:hypothetical protein